MINVRQATENDLVQILSIYNDVIVHTTAVYDYEPHTLEMRQAWFNTKKEQGFPVFVADEGGDILGLSSIGPFRNWAAYKYSVENSIYVAAPARGKGIGKLLIEKVKQWSKETGNKTLRLRCNMIRKEAHLFYRHLGFKEIKEQKVFEMHI